MSDRPTMQARWALLSLNFFMADMQAGIGPFLGVFLLAHGWEAGWIGTVMTAGGIAGMVMTTPSGALVDATRHKKLLVIIPGICTVLGSGVILVSRQFAMVMASQVATAIAGAVIGPAVAGMTLGIVRQAGFNRQMGLNQAFNHAGNVVGAGLSGLVGWKFGFPAVFWLAAAFGVLSIASVAMVPGAEIDDDAARGSRRDASGAEHVSGVAVLLSNKPLLVLAAALALFHLGNGAVLPLYGMAMTLAKQGDPAQLVAITIVVAQGTMIIASLVAMHLGAREGYWWVLLISFVSLPIRAVVASYTVSRWGVYPVQILDGVGAGLQSVAVPALVARLLDGSGRVNVGQGAVMTMQGLGASLSPVIGGWIAQAMGYQISFLVLGAFALVSTILWLACAPWLRPACAGAGNGEASLIAAGPHSC